MYLIARSFTVVHSSAGLLKWMAYINHAAICHRNSPACSAEKTDVWEQLDKNQAVTYMCANSWALIERVFLSYCKSHSFEISQKKDTQTPEGMMVTFLQCFYERGNSLF